VFRRALGLAVLLLLTARADEVVIREGVITNVPAHPRLYVPTPEALASSAANEELYTPLIETAAERYGLETALVKAVVKVESAFFPKAFSKAGAMGLMQLMPATARELGVSDPWDPATNLDGGCRYLRLMLERFGGDLRLSLAAYNAGPRAVEHYGGVPPYPETQRYVVLVLDSYRRYGGDSEGTVELAEDTSSAPVYIAPDGTITNVPPTP
jgi:soluble lytic murein transglycosylase-like protein